MLAVLALLLQICLPFTHAGEPASATHHDHCGASTGHGGTDPAPAGPSDPADPRHDPDSCRVCHLIAANQHAGCGLTASSLVAPLAPAPDAADGATPGVLRVQDATSARPRAPPARAETR